MTAVASSAKEIQPLGGKAGLKQDSKDGQTAAFTRLYLLSAGAVLAYCGAEHLVLSLWRSAVIAFNDPVFGVPFRFVLLAFGILNLTLGLLSFFSARRKLVLGLIAWLSLNGILYWIGLWCMDWTEPFPLVAYISETWRISTGVAGILHALALAYLLFGSVACALAFRRAEATKDSLKMSCPACGGHIQFAVRNLGQKSPCPHCQKEVSLRKPDESLKMSCFFCQGHIEFPSHALGTKMPCPHCHRDITLVEPK